MAPRVFSLPSAAPFLRTLAEALLAGELIPGFPDQGDPFSLAHATILLPTRRACRALADVFRDISPQSVLLPRLRPLADVEESDLLLSDLETESGGVDLPPPIAPLERQIVLTRLILEWAKSMQDAGDPVLTPASPADAAYLAGELARFLDMLASEGVDWQNLRAFPPLDLQQHWQAACRFLDIAGKAWPAYLEAAGRMEPVTRRGKLMQAEAARLLTQPNRPVIAAGSTGSVTTSAEFLVAVARHPAGALVLPGLDRDLDEGTWRLIGAEPVASHPQAALASLLARLKITRNDVQVLGKQTPIMRKRERFMAEVMRPAETSEAWAKKILSNADMAAALRGVALVEAASEREEALAIACLMRETLETKRATAALVTPDRLLARRVTAELKRFGLTVDDSAGTPLNQTPAGIFARLVADVALKNCEGAACLALLKHPYAVLGQDKIEIDEANQALERLIFRGPTLFGINPLLRRMGEPADTEAARKLTTEQRKKAAGRLQKLCAAMRPLVETMRAGREQAFSAFLNVHAETLQAFAKAEEDGAEGLLPSTPDGEALLEFFETLAASETRFLPLAGADYPALLNVFMSQQPVRPVYFQEPRLRIYGLLEARLMSHDRLILGGLNEGVWPAAGASDPWLSRGMRAALGLPAPERRIGLSAHDFVQAIGHEDVWLMRSIKSGGAPSIPSRFMQRLAAVAGENAFDGMRERGQRALHYARILDAAPKVPQPQPQPEPRPPARLRPRSLPVTQIETLVRDPYSIYARYVLKLQPFEQIGEGFSARERGIVVHGILSDFARAANAGGPVSVQALEAIAERAYAPYFDRADVEALWWPRFRALIPQLVSFEKRRRAEAKAIYTEIEGALTFDLPAGPFTLKARADRIEQKADGIYTVIDYKTGALPSAKQAQVGFSPQLPLEAAMLAAHAFALQPGEANELLYVGTGGIELKERAIEGKDETVAVLAERTLARLRAMLTRFDDEKTPYRPLQFSKFALRFGDYDHLARAREWGLAGAGEADG